ncbi:hypothetical protein Tco_0472768 [Tanacetum coccineum]
MCKSAGNSGGKDDSDLRPTAALRPCNREHQTRDTTNTTRSLVLSTQTPEIAYFDETAVRIILGPMGIVQAVKILVSAVESEGGIMVGCFGDMKTFCQNGKLSKVVAVVKYCTPNAWEIYQ